VFKNETGVDVRRSEIRHTTLKNIHSAHTEVRNSEHRFWNLHIYKLIQFKELCNMVTISSNNICIFVCNVIRIKFFLLK
jgi:hypothetical protein